MNTITYTTWDSPNRNERVERTIEQSPKMISAMKKLKYIGETLAELRIRVK